MRRTHWLGEDVKQLQTTLADLESLLPAFERYGLGRNRFRDVIVRPGPGEPLPVGVVSKRYVLVQHAEAMAAVTAEIIKARIDPAAVHVQLEISEYGTRIAVRATLPPQYAFTPADGHPMALTFECFNSVDGTVPLLAAVGWFRFVCSNGLVVGTTSAKVRQRHSQALNIEDVSAVLAEGMSSAITDRKLFSQWHTLKVAHAGLVTWVDGPVAEAWGPLAAARVYGISTTGLDGTAARTSRALPPHQRPLVDTAPVPGTHAPCTDAYALAQVLAWVAAQRGNVGERLKWRAEIPALMSRLAA